MLKKTVLYTFASIGVIACILALKSLITVSGQTLYSGGNLSGPEGMVFASSRAKASIKQMNQVSWPAVDTKQERMIVRNARLNLEVSNINQSIQTISTMASQSGGYVVSSNFYDSGNRKRQQSATIIIRIPAKGLNNALTQLKDHAISLLSEEINGEDITKQFIDLQSKKRNLENALEQLKSIMNKATKISDVLKIFSEQTQLQSKLDVLTGRIQYYKQAVAFSRITINLSEDKAAVEKFIQEQNQWRLTKIITNAYHSLLIGLKSTINQIVFIIIAVLPIMLLWGVIITLLYLIGNKIYRYLK